MDAISSTMFHKAVAFLTLQHSSNAQIQTLDQEGHAETKSDLRTFQGNDDLHCTETCQQILLIPTLLTPLG